MKILFYFYKSIFKYEYNKTYSGFYIIIRFMYIGINFYYSKNTD